jgi:hypothetical protein
VYNLELTLSQGVEIFLRAIVSKLKGFKELGFAPARSGTGVPAYLKPCSLLLSRWHGKRWGKGFTVDSGRELGNRLK